MYQPQKLEQQLVAFSDICTEINKASTELQEHCKLISDQQAIIADLMNRVKLLEEDLIKRSCC